MRGTIATSTIGEIFQHSIAINSSETQGAVATLLGTTFGSNFGTASTLLAGTLGPLVTYTEVTAATINDLHGVTKPVLQAATHNVFGTPLVGALAGSQMPAQNSVAVSLTAGAKPNGAPYKGRFYLPPTIAANVQADGLLLGTTRTRLTTWAGQFLNALKGAGLTPCVWSRQDGVLSPVVQTRVGDRVDTIRSRRNKGVEAYLTTAIT
jgi:hypothetical protein